jgi:hypothetical protein
VRWHHTEAGRQVRYQGDTGASDSVERLDSVRIRGAMKIQVLGERLVMTKLTFEVKV